MSGSTARQRWRDAIRDSDDPELDAYTVAVAFALDRHMSADGRTFTGVRQLEQLAHVGSQATIKSRLVWLIEAGWLTREWEGRGHKAYYQVSYPVAHLEVSHPVAHSQESEPSGEQSEPSGEKSGLPHSPDPVYPDDPEGRRGRRGDGELKLAAAHAPPLEAAGVATKGQTIAPREYQRWIVDVLTELSWDPDDIDLYDQRLIDATTPLLDRTPVEIRNAGGRHPKAVRESVRDPAAFVASKLSKLHELASDDPQWTRPDKPVTAPNPSSNGNSSSSSRDWDTVHKTLYDPVWKVLSDIDLTYVLEGDEGPGTPSLGCTFDDELDRVSDYWNRDKTPFTVAEHKAIRDLCETIVAASKREADWPDAFIDTFRAIHRLPKCRICETHMTGEMTIVDGAHDYCIEHPDQMRASLGLAADPTPDPPEPGPCYLCGKPVTIDANGQMTVGAEGRPVHADCYFPLQNTDAYQRGIARARAAISGDTVEDLL